MIAFLKANTAYEPKPSLQKCRARVRILVGGKEQNSMLRSAQRLREMLPESMLDIKEGLFHGEFSLNHPEKYAGELCDMITWKE